MFVVPKWSRMVTVGSGRVVVVLVTSPDRTGRSRVTEGGQKGGDFSGQRRTTEDLRVRRGFHRGHWGDTSDRVRNTTF